MYRNGQRIWSPFDELRSLQTGINRLFDGYEPRTAMSLFPALNVWSNEDNVVVTAELPGMKPEDLDINVVSNQLTIKGERKENIPVDDAVCHRREREHGKFVRTVRLPYAVENDKVSAGYENGVLKIVMPRHEASKPKRIEINAS